MQVPTLLGLNRIGLVVSALAAICLVGIVIVFPPPFPFAHLPQEQATTPAGPRKIIVAFRNDDITAYSDPVQESKVFTVFRNYGIPQTFSIIPNPESLPDTEAERHFEQSPILDSLRAWHAAGEITFALHGYSHKKNSRSAGEFDGLSFRKQLNRLRRGKTILERSLRTEVRMFAPPWNQADESTVSACLSLGLTEFSGYRGAPPQPGMTFLNTNAVLFPDTNYYESGHELPPLDSLLPYARRATGSCFLLVFYHSRADFATAERFAELDRILSDLRHDTLVTILSLDDIPRTYAREYAVCSIAGLNLVQGYEALHYSKFFAMPMCWAGGKLGYECSLDSLQEKALEQYYSGNYEETNLLTGKIMGRCELLTRVGRSLVILLLGVMAVIIVRRRDADRAGPVPVIRRVAPFVCAGLVALGFGVMVLLHVFSRSRADDLTILTTMIVLALLISGFAREVRRRPS